MKLSYNVDARKPRRQSDAQTRICSPTSVRSRRTSRVLSVAARRIPGQGKAAPSGPAKIVASTVALWNQFGDEKAPLPTIIPPFDGSVRRPSQSGPTPRQRSPSSSLCSRPSMTITVAGS